MGKPRIRPKAAEGIPRVSASFTGLGSGAFHGASYSHRDVATWNASRGSADADLLPDRDELVYRNRDIHRNNGVAHSGVQTIVDNVVGTGMRLSARPNYLALGKTKEWAIAWASNTQSWFHSWWHSTACHAGDTLTGDQLTVQAVISKANNGASLTLPLWLPQRRDGFSTRLKTVEVDRLCQPYGKPESPTFRKGIEFDDFGMPLAYHIRRAHPGDTYTWADYASMTWERIPRRTPHGRLRVIHDFDSERPDQSQGIPLMAAILPQFKNIDRYTLAEIQAALMNANIFATMKTPLSGEEIVDMYSKDPELWMRNRDARAVKMSSGALIALNPGDELDPFMPQRPASGFGAFVENIYRIIAVGLDMPYELLMKDFSKTTYSSARAVMLEAWRSFNRRRDWLGTMWLDPIYGLFVEELVNDGRIEAPDFYRNRSAYLRCRWIGPGKGWVDPVKEAQAAQYRIVAGVSTAEDECAEQGKDWEEVYEQQAREKQKRKELGLPEPKLPDAKSYNSSTLGPDGGDQGGDTSSQPANDGAMDGEFQQQAARAPKSDPAIAALTATVAELREDHAKLHTGMIAAQSRPQPVPEVRFEAGAFVTNVAPPSVTFAEGAMHAGETHVHMPQRGAVEKEVLERDAAGQILRVRETEFVVGAKEAQAPARRRLRISGEVVARDEQGLASRVRQTAIDGQTGAVVWVKEKTVLARDADGRIVDWSENEVTEGA